MEDYDFTPEEIEILKRAQNSQKEGAGQGGFWGSLIGGGIGAIAGGIAGNVPGAITGATTGSGIGSGIGNFLGGWLGGDEQKRQETAAQDILKRKRKEQEGREGYVRAYQALSPWLGRGF